MVTFVVFASALALRLYRLDTQSLWLDEGGTWAAVTRQRWGYLLADLVRPTAAYPLYHLLLKAWIVLAGDSEWALRLPSALAGAAMVAAVMLADSALRRTPHTTVPHYYYAGRTAGIIAMISPYALWHAQDAKAYSLLMLVVALMLWAGLHIVRNDTTSLKAWLSVGALAIGSLFVHRLALLPVAGLLLALAISSRRGRFSVRSPGLTFALTLAAAGTAALGVIGLARSIIPNGWQESGHSPASSLQSFWLNLQHFILDRSDIGGFLGLPLIIWMLPALLLTLWGLALVIRTAVCGDAGACVVLSMFVVPLLLFATALAFAPVYEARYAAVAFPAWVLLVAWPLKKIENTTSRTVDRIAIFASWFLMSCSLLVSVAVLVQPKHGLFSGAPVKEEWRAAINQLARELHPDDLLVLHPFYALPLWDYYVPRVTPDPLSYPEVFPVFGEGSCVENNRADPNAMSTCFKRIYDPAFNAAARGKKRALLLIAPDHAAVIDPPKSLADLQSDYAAGLWPRGVAPPTKSDDYGWLGLRFLYPQRSWTCGRWTFLGVEIMCQSYPEIYRAGEPSRVPQPHIPLGATFGSEIKLLGYSIDLFDGNVQPGGALPITLYWQSIIDPTKNYSMFLHLCKDCERPPLADVDEPPLHAYPPAGQTSTWRGYPVHDERSLALPANLTPGRYTLLLGIRPVDEDPFNLNVRLPVESAQGKVIDGTRLVLGTIEIQR